MGAAEGDLPGNPACRWSFTITEKGYACATWRAPPRWPPADIEDGPPRRHAMGMVAALLYQRFRRRATPVAVASMDNCSHNGEKLKAAVLVAMADKGLRVPAASSPGWRTRRKVSFPWTMIDKITPRPPRPWRRLLRRGGIEGMAPGRHPREAHLHRALRQRGGKPQYLVVEDRFPNGRPPLEAAGFLFTDRETVNKVERMKVTTCLNPLHTALAVYGCLLGYTLICDEMKDAELVKLIERIGYVEGLPVVTDPGILSPKAFIDEVVNVRLPNPFMPDTPQRIATDTSQKIPIRFGETIKSYLADPGRDAADLTAIPLAIAGWLRYLLGVDDEGHEMPVSPDPMLGQLQSALCCA